MTPSRAGHARGPEWYRGKLAARRRYLASAAHGRTSTDPSTLWLAPDRPSFETSAEVATAIASGDLSRKSQLTSAEILQLKENLNTMVDQLKLVRGRSPRARRVGHRMQTGRPKPMFLAWLVHEGPYRLGELDGRNLTGRFETSPR